MIHLLQVMLISASLMASQLGFSRSTPAQTPQQSLKLLGIDADKTFLMSALQDPRSQVRSLAAGLLADDGVQEAVPRLESLMESESDQQAVFTLAQSLNILHSKKGQEKLESYCSLTHPQISPRIMD